MSDNAMTCAQWDVLLQDHLEGELAETVQRGFDSHASRCVRCQGVMRDLTAIRTAAGDLPQLEPSSDLWAGIAARIEPPVVSIGARRPAHTGIPRLRLAAAAAGLIVLSSGVTYFATSRSIGAGRAAVVATDAPAPIAVAAESDAEASVLADLPASSEEGAPGARAGAPADRSGRTAPLRTPGVTVLPASETEQALSAEITELQQLLAERREALDPATVKVVEDNLALIDLAVRQARNALAADPASGFLSGQLDNALQKKVRLLRTIALLPSTT